MKTLGTVVEITTGRSFRKAIKPSNRPTHQVLQISNISSQKTGVYSDFSDLVQTEIPSKGPIKCLKDNDIIIVAKGSEKHICLLKGVPPNTVCTQHFLILSENTNAISQEFVYHFLRSEVSQNWMNSNAGGSYQSTLSKTALEQLPFPDITGSLQLKYVALSQSIEDEVETYHQLIYARKQQLNTVADSLLEGVSSDK